MAELYDVQMRLGANPSDCNAFKLLLRELANSNHPACPDVDWLKVEALCLALFRSNGVELQTAVAWVMARSCNSALVGLSEGLAMLATLLEAWPRLWPEQASIRLDLLEGLFTRLRPVLRTQQWTPANVSALALVAEELDRVERQLARFTTFQLTELQALRRQVGHVRKRFTGDRSLGVAVISWAQRGGDPVIQASGPAQATVQRPFTFRFETQASNRGVYAWLLGFAAVITLMAVFGWQHVKQERENDAPAPPAVDLDSLHLFDRGSAQLRPGSEQRLISILDDIRAKPGWLIVIAGHADASGDAIRNLELSRARAHAVRDWIKRRGGLPDSCFAIQAFAATLPLSSNETSTGRAANRRVEVRLVPDFGTCALTEDAVHTS